MNHFPWNTTHIATPDDAKRIQEKVFSGTLPSPNLFLGDIEARFQVPTLANDIENEKRALVLLERKKWEIMGILELFHSHNYPGLFYSKTLLQWGRSTPFILPEVLWNGISSCTRIALPYAENGEHLYDFSRYHKGALITEKWSLVKMYVTSILKTTP